MKGETIHPSTDILLSLRCSDYKEIWMLSPIQSPEIITTRKIYNKRNIPIRKNTTIVEYNNNVGAVDKIDIQIIFVECVRKSLKWFKAFFLLLVNITVLMPTSFMKRKINRTLNLVIFVFNLSNCQFWN